MSAFAVSRRSINQRLARVPRLFQAEDWLSSKNQPHNRPSSARRLFKTAADQGLADPASQTTLESFLVNALVQAGRCGRHHHGSLPQSHLPNRTYSLWNRKREHRQQVPGTSRSYSTDTALSEAIYPPVKEEHEISLDELKSLLTYYRESDYSNATPSPTPTTHPPPVAPSELALDDEPEAHEEAEDPGQTHWPQAQELIKMCKDKATSPEELFDLYQQLPLPRITYLPEKHRDLLLRRLSVMEKMSEQRTWKYLSVLDDMHGAGIAVSQKQWTSAIRLAGRAMPTVSAKEAESALRLWKRMEKDMGLRGDTVTFNVLLDIAVRAERLPLAEMILNEMAERQLPIDRFGHVAIICYHGLRQDGDAIRHAYRILVESGQVVNTQVLNAVMAALLRAGESPAADEVLARLNQLHARRTGADAPPPPPLDWRARRDLSYALKRLAAGVRPHVAFHRKAPPANLLTPDAFTYTIFLRHYAGRTGELARVAVLLNEMQSAGLPPSGRIYLELLRGFFLHGGGLYSDWTAPRLESVWRSYLDVLDAGAEGVTLERWIAIWAVRAFARCAGRERSLEVWAEIQTRWTPEQGDESVILGQVWKKTVAGRAW